MVNKSWFTVLPNHNKCNCMLFVNNKNIRPELPQHNSEKYKSVDLNYCTPKI